MIEYILFWIVCSIVCVVMSFSHFQKAFPKLADEDYYRDMFFVL